MTVKNIIFDLDNTLYSPTSAMDAGITNRMMLYSKKEWKKTSMKYFCEP